MTAVALSPLTLTGVGDSNAVVAGSPSWPALFRPQHCMVPSGMRTQVWKPPAVTVAAPPIPATAPGVEALVVVPSPSSPVLLSPQQRTVPS